MASAWSLPKEDYFLCSICLGDFTEPVSTPCGHNYCKNCITGYWDKSDVTQCPMCKEKFKRRPKLRVNTEFRDMMEHFNRMKLKSGDEMVTKPGEVPCDICPEPKFKAHKTCLVCLASYCQTHLEPHQHLKKHKLIDPVSNLEDRVCKKHDKMLEFFCSTDQECVCFKCLKDDHDAHEAVPLERATQERKVLLKNVTSEMQVMENNISTSVNKLKCSVQQSKSTSERDMEEIDDVFAALLVFLQRKKDDLIELVLQKHKTAETKAEDHIAQLEREAADLTRRRCELEQLLQSEDCLHILQKCPSLQNLVHIYFSPPLTQDVSDVSQHIHAGMVKKTVVRIEKIAGIKMENLLHDVRFSESCEVSKQVDATTQLDTDDFAKEMSSQTLDDLMLIQQNDGVNVTLDAYTANSKLVVSDDGKKLTFRKSWLTFPSLFNRKFEYKPFVLATEGFSSGRFYYEVQVSTSQYWVLGVVIESINRQISLGPGIQDGAWLLYATGDQYFVNMSYPQQPWRKPRAQKVGVFVDIEGGEISFYNVNDRCLLTSLVGCIFTKLTNEKGFLHSITGASYSRRTKVYPVFGIYGDDPGDSLVITPVDCTTREAKNVMGI
ncbi:E3 ubiquitin-protein ligase TRIM39-like [Cololabis saira]|uniref:E3 ubiquitin-protein ligase TRIM39-like n=1 Tax=Cololabis saira TaxID=129043 RepID=UPI002AD21B92|nr:E3 ubiquitin-protein ligase TRIM39-like [Cololabis saira]XP_061570862.1 E3 ubiquitin-protein ligase TRIM39-like [Cololabis saira]XP_061570863.1 E3 ubiquitin-protein ligase TRIM39-like [Cololabis saira]